MQTYLKYRSPWIQLVIFIGIAFASYMLLAFLGAAAFSSVSGIPLSEFFNAASWNASNPNAITIIRVSQTFQFLGMFLLPSLLFAKLADPHPNNFLGLNSARQPLYVLLGIAALLISIPFVNYTGVLNHQIAFGAGTKKIIEQLENENKKLVEFMLSRHTISELLINLVVISLFAGIGEELFFRGVLQRIFIRAFKSPWAGILVTAALFSAFHFEFYGFIPRFILGALLGTVYWYSGSLWTSIIAHFVYDGLVIVIAYFYPQVDMDQASAQGAGSLAVTLISVLLTAMVVYTMVKKSNANYHDVYKNDDRSDHELSF